MTFSLICEVRKFGRFCNTNDLEQFEVKAIEYLWNYRFCLLRSNWGDFVWLLECIFRKIGKLGEVLLKAQQSPTNLAGAFEK